MDAETLLREGLERLRRDYLDHLPGKVATIAADWSRCRSGEPGAFERLALEVHHLAGTGATFGRPDVSEAAGALEAALADGHAAALARGAEVSALVGRLSHLETNPREIR
jgi:hypothetical protein